MLKTAIVLCAVVFFTATPSLGAADNLQPSAISTEEYVSTKGIHGGSGILERLLDNLQENHTCATGKACIFRYDFAYWIWSPDWDNTIYIIDVADERLPIFQGIENEENLYERVEKTTIDLLESMGFTSVNIEYNIIGHFPNLTKYKRYIEVGF